MKDNFNKKELIETITPVIENTAMRYGLIPLEILFERENNRWFLRIFIYSTEHSISHLDCENISRALDNLLDDLIGGKTENEKTIKQVIEEAKNEQELEETMDKSFFTNSLNLTNSDFENLKEMHTDIKKNNKLLMIISFIVVIAIIAVLVVLLFK